CRALGSRPREATQCLAAYIGGFPRVRGFIDTTLLPSFFLSHTATTEIYTLSLHDALPISGAPTGANLDASSGVFTWTPGNAQSPSTNIVTIQVADNGTPSLSATQTFTIFVNSSLHISEIRKVDATHLSIICETQSGKNYQV